MTQNTIEFMPKILLENVQENAEEWHKLRLRKVSASNIATLIGLNPFRSPLEAWAEWTARVPSTFNGNRSTALGVALEPLVAKWFSEETGLETKHVNTLYGDAELDWLVCTPDYEVLQCEGAPLEVKTGNPRQAQKWVDGAPLEYVLQVQVQLHVLKKTGGYLCGMLGDPNDIKIVEIDYDKNLVEMALEKASSFLECVERDIPPVAGAGDAALLRRLIGEREKTTLMVDGEQAEELALLVASLRDVTGALKSLNETAKSYSVELERSKKEKENRIRQLLGTAEAAQLPDGRVVRVSTVKVGEKVVGAYSYEKIVLPRTKN